MSEYSRHRSVNRTMSSFYVQDNQISICYILMGSKYIEKDFRDKSDTKFRESRIMLCIVIRAKQI